MLGTRAIVVALALAGARAQDCPSGGAQPPHDQARLHADLMCDYNTEYRPVLDHRDTVTVQVGLILKYISFDAQEETFTVHNYLTLSWQDQFLKWEPNNYGGINRTFIESHQIWTPQMSLFNADASKYQSDSFFTTCKLSYDGSVTCVPHMAHTGICSTSLKRWPYDQQNCTLYFGSWMHTGEQINFTFATEFAVSKEDYQDGPGWRLVHVARRRYPGKYNCCPNETYPMLKYSFLMRREAAGPAAIVVVPSIAIVTLTLTSFMLDIKDNTRLIVSCFSLFCHFMFLTEIGYDIPKESSDTPIILLFIRDSMVVTLSAVLLTLSLMALRARAAPAPAWLARAAGLAAAGPARYAVFTEFDPAAAPAGAADAADAAAEPARPSTWLQLSNILNSVLLVIFVLTYAILVICYIPRED